jgi:hypothetical protein|tara:strand:+ start:734 stop:1000 length:267 start_codon:yes stop_codon:yes gene_type:complete
LGLIFFGLTPTYRVSIFKQIHEIVFHGKGGYDFDTVYNMPIWLRNFTFKSIQEFYEKEKEEYDKVNKKSQTLKGGQIKKPTYSTRARK